MTGPRDKLPTLPPRDRQETLDGVPLPPLPPVAPTLVLHELLAQAVREAVGSHLMPVRLTWDARSQDMLDVLADSAEARAQVKRAATTIRVAGWLGVLAMIVGSLAVSAVLERERVERRAARELDQKIRSAEFAELARRVDRRCAP